jgi:threonine dehydrogenase-like Zn-dependent dehydrogenase
MSNLINMLGRAYSALPPTVRPYIKRTATYSMLRGSALTQRRRVCNGRRVEFLDFEIAHLEPFEFLGPGPNEVLVRSLRSCVSPGTERAVLCGLPGARRRFPYVPGYSTCGVVIVAGRTSGFAPGDMVAGRMPHASHGIMGPQSLFRVAADVAPEEACFLELGIITLQGIRKARIRPGDRVAVVGQGLIGQMAVRAARLVGADPIVAVAASRRRVGPAMRPGGADEFVALSDGVEAIAGLGADIVIEAVGSSRAITLAMEAAREGGTVVLLGSSRDLGRGLDWWNLAQRRKLTLVGAHISVVPSRDASAERWTYQQEGRLFLDLLAERRLSVSDLITWRVLPTDCNKVYEVLAEGGRDQVGVVFDWEGLGDQEPRGGK